MLCPNCGNKMLVSTDRQGQYYCCHECWTMADANGIFTDEIQAPTIDEPIPPRRKPINLAEVWLDARGVIAGLGVHDTVGMRISARDFVNELGDYRIADRNQTRRADVNSLIDNLRRIEC